MSTTSIKTLTSKTAQMITTKVRKICSTPVSVDGTMVKANLREGRNLPLENPIDNNLCLFMVE